MAIAAEDEIEIDKEEIRLDCMEGEEHEVEEDDTAPILSMNVVSGSVSDNMLKLKGHLKRKPVIILIDSGSTHSFIDLKLVKDLKLVIISVPLVTVTIADGKKLMVDQKLPQANWVMQNQSSSLISNFRIGGLRHDIGG